MISSSIINDAPSIEGEDTLATVIRTAIFALSKREREREMNRRKTLWSGSMRRRAREHESERV